MRTRVGWVVAGAIAGVLLVGPLQSYSAAGTGPALIRVNDRQLTVSRVDLGARGTSAGDIEVVRTRLLERGTRVVIGHSELVCTFVDGVRTRVCRGTYALPKGKIVVGGSILYRQFYDLAVLGGTGLYDNARGTLTVTRTHKSPVRDLVFFRLVG
ncbi:MAG: hypothetical protein HOQ03_09735 [Thermoleophilia bacterium]|nr:hypothetical protein [Thermoleophilia bacterium]